MIHVTSNDEAMKELIQLTRQGWPNAKAEVPVGAKVFFLQHIQKAETKRDSANTCMIYLKDAGKKQGADL